MLNEKFLSRLRDAFPTFYTQVNAEARREAEELLADAGGDVQQALVRARLQGSARVWIPYVRGTIPLMGNERPAMEAFSRLVLTVDHLVGYEPESMEAARDQVVQVLRNSLDVERLRRLLDRDEKRVAQGAAAATAASGILASATALLSPITAYRQARRWLKFVPAPMRVAAGGVVAAAVLSIPLVAGYSAGIQAEKAARQSGTAPGAGNPTPAGPASNGASSRARESESRSVQPARR